MQQHHHYVDRRQPPFMDNKTRNDDFYAKLERIRLSASASSSKHHPQRTAAELLDESKAFFVKSQEVLHNRQTLSNNQRIIPSFRIAQPRRSPYHDREHELSIRSSTPPTADISSDCAFESVSLLSLSDQTTFDSTNSLTHRKRAVVSSSVTIIERNARIIKWLFQLQKANASPSFQCP